MAALPPPSSRIPYRWAVESSAFISFNREARQVRHPVPGLLRAVDRAGAARRSPAPRGAPVLHARDDAAVLRPWQRVGRAGQRRGVARLLRPHPPDALGARAVPLLGPASGGIRVVLPAKLAERAGRQHAGAADGQRRRDRAAPARRHGQPRRSDPRRAAALRLARQRDRHRQRPVPPDQAARQPAPRPVGPLRLPADQCHLALLFPGDPRSPGAGGALPRRHPARQSAVLRARALRRHLRAGRRQRRARRPRPALLRQGQGLRQRRGAHARRLVRSAPQAHDRSGSPASSTPGAPGPSWHRTPSSTAPGIGLKYGVGGGLRVQEGKTFVVRGDVAWSPDARPIGGYVTAGQAF